VREPTIYSDYIRSLIDRLMALLEPLDEAQLNEQPPLPGANSPYVIATHVLGSARAWVLGIACGQPLRRDRPAEFTSSGVLADIKSAWRELSRQIEPAVAGLKPADLERELTPQQELWGEGEPQQISVRWALLHQVEHAAIHLGQLQITRDVALRHGSGQALQG
jgi:hypothetical protein